MDKFWIYLGGVFAIVLFLIFGASCGKPSPSDFSLTVGKVKIEGKMKPGAGVSAQEAQRSLSVAAEMIDKI